MKFLGILVLLASTFLGEAKAEGFYYRLWQGKKRASWPKESQKAVPWAITPSAYYKAQTGATGLPALDFSAGAPLYYSQFQFLVNDILIPATVSCCAQESLLAYMPVLSPVDSFNSWQRARDFESSASELAHDELALLVYRSQAAYENWRQPPAGKTIADLGKVDLSKPENMDKLEATVYGPLHADVFEMATPEQQKDLMSSRSQVPTPYPGKIIWPAQSKLYPKEVAHDLLGSTHDWQDPKAQVGYRFWRRWEEVSEADYLKRIESYLDYVKCQKENSLYSYVFLVTDRYFIEFVLAKDVEHFFAGHNFFDARTMVMSLLQKSIAKDLAPSLERTELVYPHLQAGEMGRALFTPGERSKKKDNWLLKH